MFLGHVARILSSLGKLCVALGVGLIGLAGYVIASKWWTYYTDPSSMRGHGWAISPILFSLGATAVIIGGFVYSIAS